MKNKARQLADIQFTLNDKNYQATVFVHLPVTIIIPDENLIVRTSLSPRLDTSTLKNRYRRVTNATITPEDTTKEKRRQKSRSIFDTTGQLNRLITVSLPTERPLFLRDKHVVVARKL